jgi:mannosyltransferase OCH1-like enzyme
MIPKKLHYCWLSENEKPAKTKECIDSWQKVMPDYQLVRWDGKKFDINSNPFVAEACKAKKWAFAADYIRLYALYTEGGIYLDTDVIVRKKFDEFLKHDFFTSVEYHEAIVESENSRQYLDFAGTSREKWASIPGIGIQAAILGSIKGNQYLKDCLDYYQNQHFILESGEYNNKLIAPAILAIIAGKYGFRYKDEKQELGNNMVILPSNIFASTFEDASEESFAIHCCFGSWRDGYKTTHFKKIKSFFTKLHCWKINR